MSIHENQSREANGEFGKKNQTIFEIEKMISSDDDGHMSLAAGETMVYSHAEGHFDAADLGFEGIEVWRNEDGGLEAEAYVDLDFGHLAQLNGASNADQWLTANKTQIGEAVTRAYPGTQLDHRNRDWENQVVTFAIVPASGEFPDFDGILEIVTDDARARQMADDLPQSNDQRFWRNVSAKLAEIARESDEDADAERAGIRKLGSEGRI